MRQTRRVSSLSVVILAVLMLTVFMGCEGPLTPSATGSLEVRIAQNLDGAKTLVPSLNMTPARYDITGSGPSGASFSRQITGTASATITGLAAGSWTVTVDAYNNDTTPIKIGSGTANVTIARRTTANATVTVTPLSGNGSLSITLTWPDGSITSPSVTASLTPIGGGSAISPSTNSPGATGGTLTWDNNVPAGYYTLSIQVLDGSTVVAGKADSVRILSGLTTTGAYAWTVVQPGRLSLTISPQLNNPLTVNITGTGITISNGAGTLTEGSTATLTASASGGTTPYSYTWYQDGAQVGTSSTLTVGTGWTAGEYYQIDVIASDASTPTSTGSATVGITVTP